MAAPAATKRSPGAKTMTAKPKASEKLTSEGAVKTMYGITPTQNPATPASMPAKKREPCRTKSAVAPLPMNNPTQAPRIQVKASPSAAAVGPSSLARG